MKEIQWFIVEEQVTLDTHIPKLKGCKISKGLYRKPF
jgi:ribosome-associated protein YbcJ (S4-like RNA binding protein)